MPELIYIQGDITKPIAKNIVIAHVCNDLGLMGSGVAKALSDKWRTVKWCYEKWHETNYRSNRTTDYYPFELGKVQFVQVDDDNDIVVCNMIAQHSIMSRGEKKPIRYDALRECLKEVYKYCHLNKMNLHMPKIGSVRAGGDWDTITDIIKEEMTVDTYIYEYEGTLNK